MTGIGHISPLTFLLCIYVKTIKTRISSSVYHFLSPLAFSVTFQRIYRISTAESLLLPFSSLLPFLLTTVILLRLANRGLSLDTSSVVRSGQQLQTKSKTERKKGGNAGREAFKAPHKIKS